MDFGASFWEVLEGWGGGGGCWETVDLTSTIRMLNTTPLISKNPEAQRAENGGLDPSWLDLAFLGAPIFSPEVSKPFRISILGPLD